MRFEKKKKKRNSTYTLNLVAVEHGECVDENPG